MINGSDFPIIKKLIEKFGGKVNEGQLNSAIDAKVANGTIASGEQLDSVAKITDVQFDGSITVDYDLINAEQLLNQSLSNVIDTTKWQYGVAKLNIGWGTGHFEASSDNLTFRRIKVRNKDTGTEFDRIDMKGEYSIDLRGVNYLKYVVDYNAPASGTQSGVIDLFNVFINENLTTQKQNYRPTLVDTSIIPINRIVTDLDLTTATIYATAGNNISKSTDYGTTWTNIITTGHPWGSSTLNGGVVKKLKSGKLLVIVKDNGGKTQMYLSDTNEQNFTLKYEFPVEGIAHIGFGVSVYNNVILFTAYKPQPRLSTDPLRCHMSVDGGETWKVIRTAKDMDTWHFHEVVYDPYKSRIWIANGDFIERANVYYSDDMGTTWKSLWEDGKCPTQITTIHPMGDIVIFGTDQVGIQGAYRYSYSKNVAEPCYLRGDVGRTGDATYRGHQMWDMGAVYIASKNETCIFATKDGYNFYKIYTTTDSTISVNSIWGIDKNNNIICVGSQGVNNILFKLPAPTWELV